MSTNKKHTAIVIGSRDEFGAEIVQALDSAGFAITLVDVPVDGLEKALEDVGTIDAMVINRPFRAGTTRFSKSPMSSSMPQ